MTKQVAKRRKRPAGASIVWRSWRARPIIRRTMNAPRPWFGRLARLRAFWGRWRT